MQKSTERQKQRRAEKSGEENRILDAAVDGLHRRNVLRIRQTR